MHRHRGAGTEEACVDTRWAMTVRALVTLAVVFASGLPVRAEGLRSSAFLTYALRGERTVDEEGRHLERISVFAYHLTEDGDVVPPNSWVPDVIDRRMRDPGDHLILITVNNRMLDDEGRPTPFHQGDETFGILADPARRAEHVRQLAALSRHAHGIELNYERLPAEAREHFTVFIRELRRALPPGKKLSVVLQPKTDDARGMNGRAVDWRAIEPFVDSMPIMAYYYSWSTSAPGPVVPMETLRRLADYALDDPAQKIPRHKVAIILSTWGWDWPLSGDEPGRLIPFAEAMEIARTHGAELRRDPEEHSLNFRYTDDGGIEHEIWIDDFESLRRRIRLLEARGMPRVHFWHLNTGAPRLWRYVARRTSEARFPGPSFDGGSRTDLAVFRPSSGRWLVDTTQTGGTDLQVTYGREGDIPVPADYDGDGREDFAVFRPSWGAWYVDLTGSGGTDLHAPFGKTGDVPVPADYDGDGRTDFAVFDPRTGRWLVDSSHDGEADLQAAFGTEGDVPVPGDYDGDGRDDFAVFRPATATWMIDTTRSGRSDLSVVYGMPGDVPVPLDYDGDGRTDFAVFRPSYGGWFVDLTHSGGSDFSIVYGRRGDVPVPGNYDGDGIVDFAVFRPASGEWWIDTNRTGGTDHRVAYGRRGDVPIRDGGWIHDSLRLTPTP